MSSRREFLGNAGRISLATWAALGRAHLARAAAAGQADTLELLAGVARTIYPHDGLADEVYAGVVGDLLTNPDRRRVLVSGVAELADFLTLNDDARVARLQSLEDTEFFVALKTPLMFTLYNTHALWDLIGYPGPSFPEGYINRGFDDIDWLPER
ncbi:MAG: hypothetical protein P8Y69_04275 [Gammaproteobacteria bacterium]